MAISFTPDELEFLVKVENEYEDLGNDRALWEKVYEYFLPEMPYGTAKARTGDPSEWIGYHLHELLSNELA